MGTVISTRFSCEPKIALEKWPIGVSWQLSKLRIWCCHCRGSGYCYSSGSIPGLGNSACHGYGQKNDLFFFSKLCIAYLEKENIANICICSHFKMQRKNKNL